MWAMGATRLLDLVHGLTWDAIVIYNVASSATCQVFPPSEMDVGI